MFKCVVRDEGELSNARIARRSRPTPPVYVITAMVVNHAPSVPILSQFLSGSMSVNLAFQLSDKTLKPSYLKQYSTHKNSHILACLPFFLKK